MKYAVVTFGCRVNQADSMAIEEQLLAEGAVPGDAEHADVVVVNTCSVTASADQAARQTVRRLSRINPSARIIVSGCYATRRPAEVAGLPGVVRVVPNDDKPRLVDLIRQSPADEGPALTTALRFGEGAGSCGEPLHPGTGGRTAFTLRVQTGCAEQCSYCIIPATRGQPRSVPLDDVLVDVGRVVNAGFKEIALTGVHLGSYGRDLEPRSSLSNLLRALQEWCAGRVDVLFRISSLEPMDCTADVVDLVARGGCFAPHFHLPLQHASNAILAAMRRPYTIEYYRELVDRVRDRMPNASIGSDIIVGFPGETDADFAQLTAYLQTSPLTHVHVFPYSDREGTTAAAMRQKIHGSIVRDRGRAIREIGQELTRRFRNTQVGSVHRGLTIEDGSVVVTGNYLKLRVAPGRARNEWVAVMATSHHDGELLPG